MEINTELTFSFKDYLVVNLGYCEKYGIESIYGVNEFVSWIKVSKRVNSISIEDISLGDIAEYTIYLKNKKLGKTSRYYGESEGLSTRTIQMRLNVLRNLFKRTRKYYGIGIDPKEIDLPKNKKRKMEYLTMSEVEELIDHINKTEKRVDTRMRNILILKVAFNVGLRKSELLDLRISDIKRSNCFEIIGKGAKSRSVYFTNDLRAEIMEYYQYRTEIVKNQRKLIHYGFDTDFVFASHSDNHYGKQLAGQSASEFVNKLCETMQKEYGRIKHFTLHSLRHGFATQAIRNNVNIVVLKELMGHNDISTTNRYTHIENSLLSENYYKIDKVS